VHGTEILGDHRLLKGQRANIKKKPEYHLKFFACVIALQVEG